MIWMNSDFITVLKSWFPVRFLHGFSQPWLANLPPCSMWKVVSPSHLQVVLPPFCKHILWLSSAEGCMRQPPKGFPPTGVHMLRTWQRQVSSLTNRNACHANWKYFNFAFHSSRYFINPVSPNCKYFWILSSDGNSVWLSPRGGDASSPFPPLTGAPFLAVVVCQSPLTSCLPKQHNMLGLQGAFPQTLCSFALQWGNDPLLRLAGPTGRQSTCFMNQEIARQGNSRQL